MKKQLIVTNDLTKTGMQARGVWANCYRLGNLVAMTGQTAFTLDGELVGVGDPARQTRQALDNITALMERSGGRLSDVVKIVVYVTDRAYRAQVYPLIEEYFGELKPCSTGLVVQGLAREELLVEIDAWGWIDD